MSKYTLTADDIAYATRIAEFRNAYEDVHGPMVKNPRIQEDEDKSLHTHLVGTIAEVGLARYYGHEPNLTYETDGKGGRKPDLTLFGYTVEVKATERKGASRLIVPKGRLREADVYFLVYVDISTYSIEIRGWCFWHDVIDLAEESSRLPLPLREKPIWAVHEKNLRKAKIPDA